MRNHRVMSVDNSPVVIESYYDIWMCHEGEGTDLVNTSTNPILGDLSLNGTAVGIWDNAGHFTPQGDHQLQKAGVFELAYGDLTKPAFGPAQLVFFVDFIAPNNPANFETFLMYGNTSGPDMVRFTLEPGGFFQVQTKNSNNDPAVSAGNSMGDVCDGKRHSIVALVDYLNGTQAVYADGVFAASNAIDPTRASVSQSRGWGVFANMTSGAPAYNRNLSGDGSGVHINRMGVMRPAADISGVIGDIAQGMFEVQHELPRVLHGL